MKNPQSPLPPGFRFHPTDEELILHYLCKKVASTPLPVSIIAEVDIYKSDPWDLPDDWVLCRIYKKSITTLPPTADQEEEEDTILPSLKSHLGHNTLMPQKSSSFSNLFDAMDYSLLSSLLSDNYCNPPGLESTLFNWGSLDQLPLLNDSTITSTSTSSSSYLFQKLPQLNCLAPNTESQLKRQHSNLDEDMLYPAKKRMNSCSFGRKMSIKYGIGGGGGAGRGEGYWF
ncbi:hypothetical protein FH972_026747 [Carpinus fangiana]|uniref:NAC domain-containing protein n=1 Tax=Carpinus fangiana TaxID=176857 RepID=A0A5N6L5B3_9ROSI|nr:hypothetical protein FH972_026747 [Carpinus fangiana]